MAKANLTKATLHTLHKATHQHTVAHHIHRRASPHTVNRRSIILLPTKIINKLHPTHHNTPTSLHSHQAMVRQAPTSSLALTVPPEIVV